MVAVVALENQTAAVSRDQHLTTNLAAKCRSIAIDSQSIATFFPLNSIVHQLQSFVASLVAVDKQVNYISKKQTKRKTYQIHHLLW